MNRSGVVGVKTTGYTTSNNYIDNHSKTFCDKLMIDLNL